ncbi:MAG: phosphoenolpyruvate synthase [Proteobacteria bacterium]|nr:phosphoenolpyruvate synthase [Pseudomonadota bacterium]
MTSSLTLTTKAKTLESMSEVVRSARVQPLHYFSVARWNTEPEAVLTDISRRFAPDLQLIVRSSSVLEDGATQSFAGKFASCDKILGREALRAAIETVIASYGEHASAQDEVLVQTSLTGVLRAGVGFTTDASSGAPYHIIQWTDGPDTSAVTAGNASRKFIRHKLSPTPAPEGLAGVIRLLEELEELFPGTPLDVEFAVVPEGVVLLQVRALVMRQFLAPAAEHAALIQSIAAKTAEDFVPHPFLFGKRTIFGVMPDWNPAEIIGIRPRPLAFSLYRELITNSTWAYQRDKYGYKNVRSHPLLKDLCGQPFVDVRVSFNSFIPSDIKDGLADRLADYYLDRLLANPHLHDKVEFDIVLTCYSFDLDARLQDLRNAGFSGEDCRTLSDSLRNLTKRIINPDSGLWRDDAQRIKVLAERRRQLYAGKTDPVSRIYWLLEDCKRYGTLPFAGLARAGFIAVILLRSLMAEGIMTGTERDSFINNLDTISSQLPRDFASLDRSTFLAKYGHLRPGTYDILSPRYDEAPDTYFDWNARVACNHKKEPFRLSLRQMREIAKLLKTHGLEHDVLGFFDFLQAGIELRESSKFEFTRNLSDALALIVDLGERHGFSREDLSYLNSDVIYDLYRSSADIKAIFAQSIAAGREQHQRSCGIILPPLITREEDVWSFELPESEPNYVTLQRVRAEVGVLAEPDGLAGRIACISSADPGYDWLFSRGIAGLVTAYGGANSHMAIRANEMGIPAVIGAGEARFQLWSRARTLDMDCANCKVEVLA